MQYENFIINYLKASTASGVLLCASFLIQKHKPMKRRRTEAASFNLADRDYRSLASSRCQDGFDCLRCCLRWSIVFRTSLKSIISLEESDCIRMCDGLSGCRVGSPPALPSDTWSSVMSSPCNLLSAVARLDVLVE